MSFFTLNKQASVYFCLILRLVSDPPELQGSVFSRPSLPVWSGWWCATAGLWGPRHPSQMKMELIGNLSGCDTDGWQLQAQKEELKLQKRLFCWVSVSKCELIECSEVWLAKGKTFNLQIDLHSSPHLWAWAEKIRDRENNQLKWASSAERLDRSWTCIL